MSFVVTSKWAGRCQVCKKDYGIGTQVTKDNGKWMHIGCVRKQYPEPVAVREMAVAAYTSNPIADNDMDIAEIEKNGDYLEDDYDNLPIDPEPVEPPKKFAPSKYQLAIFEWIVFGDGHAVVEAMAGSGKSTTCVQAIKYLPLSVAFHKKIISEQEARNIFESDDQSRILPFEYLMNDLDIGFFAFNKHIAAELKTKLPKWCYCATLHSLGFADLRDVFGRVNVDEDKRWDTLFAPYPDMVFPSNWKQLSKEEKTEFFARRNGFKKLVSLTKATLTNANNRESVMDLIDHYGMDLEANTENFLRILPAVLDAAKNDTSLIDFEDMQWLPVSLGISLKKFDLLFVDEAQDLSDCQSEFVLRSIKDGGRAICVGDTNQSLYGFRGAGVDSMNNLIRRLNAVTLPLSITYRCPASHVKLAQTIVPGIEARENAPQGSITDTTEDKMATLIARNDMVVCRTNAPLVPVAFGLIRKGIKATIRGRDIGKNLSELASNISNGCSEMETFFFRLSDYSIREMTRLQSRRASETQIQALDDKVDTLRAVANECDRPGDVASKIESIFSDENGEIVLSSVHRCKGLESSNVWILRPDLMPFAKAKKDWEKQQEKNIIYVAYTRSKDKLYFVRER